MYSIDQKIKSASTQQKDAKKAAQEFYCQLEQSHCACVVFFCSPYYDLDVLAQELNKLFKNTTMIGCTSAGEIAPHGYTSNSITGFSLPAKNFAVETCFIQNLASFSSLEIVPFIQDTVERMKNKTIAPFHSHSFAISLLDGLSIQQEDLLQALNMPLENIPLIGGSAGDNYHFKDTHIYYQGKFHTNAAIITLINTDLAFKVESSHHLQPCDEKLVVTKADPLTRRIQEINAEPAALEYCKVTGLALEELDLTTFALNPFAVQLGEEMYIRSIQKIHSDMSLTFFCAIDVGVILTKMNAQNIVQHTRQTLNTVSQELGGLQLVIAYDCIHRRIEFEQKNLIKEISDILCKNKVIGFNTYGEQNDAKHINHTLSFVAIGKEIHGK